MWLLDHTYYRKCIELTKSSFPPEKTGERCEKYINTLCLTAFPSREKITPQLINFQLVTFKLFNHEKNNHTRIRCIPMLST